jgi:hypothetical protein
MKAKPEPAPRQSLDRNSEVVGSLPKPAYDITVAQFISPRPNQPSPWPEMSSWASLLRSLVPTEDQSSTLGKPPSRRS